MGFESMLGREGRTVTIVTPAYGTDRDNNRTKDWGAATSTDEIAVDQQDGTADIREADTGTVESRLLFFDGCSAIRPDCRVVIDGETFEVVGRPDALRRRGEVHHYEVKVRRVAG